MLIHERRQWARLGRVVNSWRLVRSARRTDTWRQRRLDIATATATATAAAARARACRRRRWCRLVARIQCCVLVVGWLAMWMRAQWASAQVRQPRAAPRGVFVQRCGFAVVVVIWTIRLDTGVLTLRAAAACDDGVSLSTCHAFLRHRRRRVSDVTEESRRLQRGPVNDVTRRQRLFQVLRRRRVFL